MKLIVQALRSHFLLHDLTQVHTILLRGELLYLHNEGQDAKFIESLNITLFIYFSLTVPYQL